VLVINTILPDKDVDCFHPFNVGRMCHPEPRYSCPATPPVSWRCCAPMRFP